MGWQQLRRWATERGIALLASLRADVFFWLSILLSLWTLQVPQIWQVLTQTVHAPALSPTSPMSEFLALLGSKSTLEASGFLVYLSLLAVVMAASVLFVVPPSF